MLEHGGSQGRLTAPPAKDSLLSRTQGAFRLRARLTSPLGESEPGAASTAGLTTSYRNSTIDRMVLGHNQQLSAFVSHMYLTLDER
jgi:hypothetical protein